MANRGNFAQMHLDIAQRVLELQAAMNDGIEVGFDTGSAETNWTKMTELAVHAQRDPLLKAQLNSTLRPALEALFRQINAPTQ